MGRTVLPNVHSAGIKITSLLFYIIADHSHLTEPNVGKKQWAVPTVENKHNHVQSTFLTCSICCVCMTCIQRIPRIPVVGSGGTKLYQERTPCVVCLKKVDPLGGFEPMTSSPTRHPPTTTKPCWGLVQSEGSHTQMMHLTQYQANKGLNVYAVPLMIKLMWYQTRLCCEERFLEGLFEITVQIEVLAPAITYLHSPNTVSFLSGF